LSACTICSHDKRAQIEIGLANKVPHRVLARRFGVSDDAVQRHAQRHLTPQMRAAILTAQQPTAVDLEALQRTEGEGLLSHLITQRGRLQTMHDRALDLGDVRAAVAVERAITENLTLTAKLLGQLVTHHEIKRTSILVSADYLQLRQAIVETLRRHPEAARDVGAVLHRLESEAATEIASRGQPVTPAVLQ
jgi:hypothetical protein